MWRRQAAYHALEGKASVDYQPFSAAKAQVRVEEGDAQRALGLAHRDRVEVWQPVVLR